MAFSTYSELIAAIREYTAQPTAPADLFIAQAEADFNGLRHRYMEKTRKVSMAANVGSIAEPADFKELVTLRMGDRLLNRISRYEDGCVDENSYYLGDQSIYVRPVQGNGAKLYLTYIAKIPALSDAQPTNWLLEHFPMVYFHAAMAHAYEWLRDEKAENASRARMGEAIAQLNMDNKRRISGGNTMVMPR